MKTEFPGVAAVKQMLEGRLWTLPFTLISLIPAPGPAPGTSSANVNGIEFRRNTLISQLSGYGHSHRLTFLSTRGKKEAFQKPNIPQSRGVALSLSFLSVEIMNCPSLPLGCGGEEEGMQSGLAERMSCH